MVGVAVAIEECADEVVHCWFADSGGHNFAFMPASAVVTAVYSGGW
jgi:hypothetical protein